MKLVAKLFVILNETLLAVLAILPPIGLALKYYSGDLSRNDILPVIVAVVVYYTVVTVAFGWLALIIENNSLLRRMVELMEQGGLQRRDRTEPQQVERREPTIR